MMNPRDVSRPTLDVRAAMRKDREEGSLLPLRTYLEKFPGDDETIAAEYLTLRDGAQGIVTAGSVFGPYHIERELGRGGQAIVFLASDQRYPGRYVALKVLHAAALVSEDLLARFRREAEVIARLDHPGLCAMHDAGVIGGTPYLAMKYIQGVPLVQLLRDPTKEIPISGPQGRLPLSEVLSEDAKTSTVLERGPTDLRRLVRIVENAARALHVAHEAGIVHRDVKPSNIVVGQNDQPVILDFGLARTDVDNQNLTHQGDLFGTPAYMSPEQVTGSVLQIDRRSDVWSLGVLLYEACAGTRPFDGATRDQLLQAILTREPLPPRKLNPHLSRDLELILQTALAKDRNHRYQTAAAFADDLDRALSHRPLLAKRAGPIRRLRLWVARDPRTAAMVLLVFTTLVLGLLATWQQMRRADREADIAEERALALRESLIDWNRLADLTRVLDLERTTREGLAPITKEQIPDLRRWLHEARRLLTMLPDHRAAASGMESELAGSTERRSLQGANAEEDLRALTFKHAKLRELIDDLSRLGVDIEERASLQTIVQRRLEASENSPESNVTDLALRWEKVRLDLANSTEYSGDFQLGRVEGLIPLGKNPQGLQEFCDLRTGTIPSRGENGELVLTAETGIVLVLLPGGDAFFGEQKTDPSLPNFHSDPSFDSSPMRRVRIDPFLISKTEMSLGQWTRLAHFDPTILSGVVDARGRSLPLNLPAQQMSWPLARQALRLLSMDLPTEVQWEYAARGGTRTRWWSGDTTSSLEGAANLRDHSHVGLQNAHFGDSLPWNDTFADLSPVGSFKPNPFGLHDIYGNVWEWCLDPYPTHYEKARFEPGTGLMVGSATRKPLRGGSYADMPSRAYSSARYGDNEEFRSGRVGIRPIRQIPR